MLKVHAEDGMAMTSLGDTLITIWRDQPVLSSWLHHAKALETLANESGEPIVLLHLILPSSPPPGSEARHRMQSDLRRLGDKVRRMIVVPIGGSLWMNLVRPIVRTVLLLSGHAKRHSVADSVVEAIRQVRAAGSARTPPERELRAAIGTLCVSLGVEATIAA
jgi:hypothetical protein